MFQHSCSSSEIWTFLPGFSDWEPTFMYRKLLIYTEAVDYTHQATDVFRKVADYVV